MANSYSTNWVNANASMQAEALRRRRDMDRRMTDAVRAKLNDPAARLVRWQQNRDGSETPVWATTRREEALALGLTVV